MLKEILEKNDSGILSILEIHKILGDVVSKAVKDFEKEIKKLGYDSVEDYFEKEEKDGPDDKVLKVFDKITDKYANQLEKLIPLEPNEDILSSVDIDDIEDFLDRNINLDIANELLYSITEAYVSGNY
jgi:hypothetical protein